ncbi:MAG TPA: STAS domain-containing protein [Vicinamibacterales bacterium]|nr:STAS domain-containing protein [Vicinamibacterales bacterium]
MTRLRTIDSPPDYSHLAIDGRLDVEGVGHIESPLTEATAARGKPVMLDMAGVSFLGSLGIGLLVRCAVSLNRRGAKIVLFNCGPFVRKTLEISKVTAVLPILDSEAAAREALAGA